MSLNTFAAQIVTGLGYELIDLERAPRGLVRVSIDHPWQAGAPERFITVEDCERVNRQLQQVLEVEGIPYERLEISSPGLDRPLRTPLDYVRHQGLEIDLTLKAAFENRKKWRGVLGAVSAESTTAWRLIFQEGKVEKALDFELNDVKEARLVPVVNFKGRAAAGPAPAAAPWAPNLQDEGNKQ